MPIQIRLFVYHFNVKIRLIKGNVIVIGRRSPYSKYNLSLVSFDEVGDYNLSLIHI